MTTNRGRQFDFERAELLDLVEQAFFLDRVNLPAEELLFSKNWEFAELAQELERLQLEEGRRFDFNWYGGSLRAFSPKGAAWVFGYYLRHIICDPNAEGVDYLWYFLRSPGGSKERDHEFVSAFSSRMKETICKFIIFYTSTAQDFELDADAVEQAKQHWCK